MKNIFIKIGLGILGVILWSQCDVLSTLPPTDGAPPVKLQSKFGAVDYHIFSQLHGEFLVGSNPLEMQKMGTIKPKGMNWRIELVENLGEEFYRIKSPSGTYLHIENGNLEATKLGAPGWHSAMWKFEVIDSKNDVYQISNRWKSNMFLQFDPQKPMVANRVENSLRHRVVVKKASEVPVKVKNPVVENPLVTPIDGDPLKNGHPNLESDLPNQANPNFTGSRGANAFVGQMKIFAGNFAPRGWAFCNGQTLSIRDNSALFSLLGTTYGGDGRTTFALPDLRGRAPIHKGKTLGGIPADYKLGKRYGSAKANVFKEEYQDQAALKKIIEISDGISIPTQKIQTQPTFSLNYIIALDGVFPSRN